MNINKLLIAILALICTTAVKGQDKNVITLVIFLKTKFPTFPMPARRAR